MDEPAVEIKESNYYAVSTSKLTVLYVATLGLYSYYWFYQHWKRQQPSMAKKINPLLRSAFYIFFTHSLAKRIENSMDDKALTGRKSLVLLAFAYIILTLAAGIAGEIAEQDHVPSYVYLIWIALLYLSVYPLVEIQDKVNIVLEDPLGQINATYSTANIIFIIFGVILWGLTLIGVFSSALNT
jgi:hypothetical protein